MGSIPIGTPPVYSITDWDKHFECNRTRELKVMQWIPLPNNHHGDGYTELIEHDNGAQHFAAWVIMLQIASRCDPRGTLVRDRGRPHTPESMGRVSRIPPWIFGEVIPRLLSMGWINRDGAISIECDNHAPIPHPTAAEGKGIELKGREGKIPPSPQGGNRSKRSMTLDYKKKHRVEKNSDLQIRIGKIKGRRASTRWTLHLVELLEAIGTPHPDDIALLEYYYAMRFEGNDYRRGSLETLLANWDGECEMARPIVAKAERVAGAKKKSAESSGASDRDQKIFDCVDELVEAMQKSGKDSAATTEARTAIAKRYGQRFVEDAEEMAVHRFDILEQQKGSEADNGK